MNAPLLREVAGYDWLNLALRGAVAVVFGLITFFLPGITLFFLVMLFGVYALVDGILSLISAFRAPARHWPLFLEGIVG